jgi:hypothetical protein
MSVALRGGDRCVQRTVVNVMFSEKNAKTWKIMDNVYVLKFTAAECKQIKKYIFIVFVNF